MKYNIIISALFLFAACKGGTGKTDVNDTSTTQAISNRGGTNVDSVNESGDRLIAANDCLTCHKIGQQSFGPSYEQIANRYDNNQGNIDNLADRIIRGGKGLWGQNEMTPHRNLTHAQAQTMVRYILSLRDSSSVSK
jgi:cytochrome c